MKRYLTHPTPGLVVAIALSSVLQNASAVSIDISSNLKYYKNWTFTVGGDAVERELIDVAPGINGVPADSTYNGNKLISDPNYNGFWTATFLFKCLKCYDVGSPVLTINQFAADDRAQLLLNDTPIDYAGLFATIEGSQGYFQSTYPGAPLPVTYLATSGIYDYGNSLPGFPVDGFTVVNGFTVPKLKDIDNTIEVIINNTDVGIGGTSLTRKGPTHFTLDVNILAFGEAEIIPVTVSEPSSIILTLAGFFTLLMCKGKRRMSIGFW